MPQRWTTNEIREQLADLGAFRGEVLEEHIQNLGSVRGRLAEAEETFLAATREARAELQDLGAEHVRRLKNLDRATAEWSARATAAGMDEGEILELLRLPRPTSLPRTELTQDSDL